MIDGTLLGRIIRQGRRDGSVCPYNTMDCRDQHRVYRCTRDGSDDIDWGNDRPWYL
jgi:hypothetical protein